MERLPEEGAVKSSADISGQQEGGVEAQGSPADSQPSEWTVAIGDLCLYRRLGDDHCDLVKVVAFRRNEENGAVDFCVNFLGSMPPLEAWVDGARLVPIKYMENYIMIEETCNIAGPSSIDQSSVLLQKQDELDESLKEKLTAAAPQVEAQLAELQMLHGEQVQKISQHKKKMSELKEHISDEFRKLYQFLHDKEQSWLEQLSGEGENILREMEENLDRLGGDLHRYQETLHTLYSKLQQQDAMFFLKDIKSFAEKCCEEGRESSPVNNALVLKDLSNGVYKGPIQYTVWKEMKSVINPGLTCMKLDPDTSHPNVFISEERTSARYTISARHLPKSAKRLSHHLAVLGQEGLSTGRHYWEVVNGDIPACDIGLVKESIYRMSLFPLCPMDGCWMFSLRNENKFVTLDGGIQSLKLRARPRRVGLYLDYEEGQLSFYNAEDMSHIYTFECPFSGKLYPYIGHGNLAKPEVPLKMFALQI